MLDRRFLVLAGCFIGLLVGAVPILATSTAVMLIPITKATGWTRGDVSGLIAAGLIGLAVGAPVVGRLIDKFSARTVIIAGSFLFPISLLIFSIAPSYSVALATAVLAGFIGSAVSHYSYLTMLPLIFDGRLGLSLGVAMFGFGVGNALMPILLTNLQGMFDWRGVFRVLAAIEFVIALPNALFLLRLPEGAKATQTKAASIESSSLSEIFTSRTFIQLVVCIFLATAVITGLGLHLTALVTDKGFTAARAGEIFSVYGMFFAFSRLGGGALLDYIDPRWIGGGIFILAGIGAYLLSLQISTPIILFSVFLVALANGIDGDLLPYVTRRYFGLSHYGSVYGALGLSYALGPPVGAAMIGRAFDLFGRYDEVLIAICLILWLSAGLLFVLGKPQFARSAH